MGLSKGEGQEKKYERRGEREITTQKKREYRTIEWSM